MKQRIHDPLDLASVQNIRELGGYQTEDGHYTKTHRLLRAAALDQLSKKDQSYLYAYGVRCVIDLRSTYEVASHPSRLEGYRGVAYYNVPMLDEMNSKKPEEIKQQEIPASLYEIYKGLILDGQAGFKRVMDIVADHPEGCILFNCTAGKDRTGLTAMLLLSIAGVGEETIIDDYAVSEHHLTQFTEKRLAEMKALGIEPPMFMFGTPPENMVKTLDLIKEKFHTVHDYLLQIGVSQAQMDKIRKSLLES